LGEEGPKKRPSDIGGSVRATPKWLDDDQRELIDIIKELDTKYAPLLIVVEGLRDERVLRSLGVQSRIIRTQSGPSRPELIDVIVRELEPEFNVLILTDFDKQGKELNRYISQELEAHRIQPLRKVRRQIQKSMKHLRCIEELVTLFERLDSPEPF
jgi:5S rRNA maturation endonuclease (ribonuclease M5)